MTIVAGVLLLGILIFFHELGHFLVAKACGVRVLTFSLGFGPRLIGFRHGDTDYRLSALPLGGYVKMYGDELQDDVPASERSRAYLHQPIWRKISIAFAGPFANFLLPFVILFIGVVGTEVVPDAVVGTVQPSEPAAKAGVLAGDRITAVDGKPVALFGDLVDVVGSKPEQEVKITVQRGSASLDLTLVPRAVASSNPLEKDVTVGRIGILATVAKPILDVTEGSAAALAGLKDKDLVISVDGAAVKSFREFAALVDAAPESSLTLVVKALEEGAVERTVTLPVSETPLAFTVEAEPLRFGVTRDEETDLLRKRVEKTTAILAGEMTAISNRRGLGLAEGVVSLVADKSAAAQLGVTPGARIVSVDGVALTQAGEIDGRLDEDSNGIHVVGVIHDATAKTMLFRMTGRPERGLEEMKYFGVRPMTTFGDAATVTRTVGVVEGADRALQGTWALITDVTKGLFALVTGQVSMKSIGGPITIFRIAGNAMELGIDRWMQLLLVISVNLGLLNLLPIPVLDGGHIVMFTIEAIKRRELTLETKERALKFGFLTLAALMVFAILNDVLRLFS